LVPKQSYRAHLFQLFSSVGLLGVFHGQIPQSALQQKELETRIAAIEVQIMAWHKSNPMSQHLATTVTLRGTVGAWIERETAERAARAAPGVVAVKNEIAIGRP